MANSDTTQLSSDWNISTDIYGIVENLDNLKKRYIEDEDETTLALGIFGYLTDTEAKKIQTSTILTGQLGNEMFPTRANLTKNVLTHAIYSNIEGINAVPAHMVLNIGIKVDDFEKYATNNRFVFDRFCPIFIDQYEFHIDYDIILIRSETSSNSYVYSAHYDMTEENRLSNITDPYLKQPFVIRIDNYFYIVFQCLVRQLTIEETPDNIISDSIIENKTYTFDFTNQIADFDVYITDNDVETKLTPLPYGTSSDGIDKYCWYLFITDNTIRITFDTKSYVPGLNSSVLIRAYTTLGAAGTFNYKKIDESSTGFFVDMSSKEYNYNKVTCYAVAATDSVNGNDKKSKEELQRLIPKANLSRGAITSETDVSNYFNLIDSDDNRLVMQKKEDNQIKRIWYGYFLLKDDEGNIIPTNTTKMHLNINDGTMKLTSDGRYILPAGTIMKYNKDEKIAYVIDESEVPSLFTDEYFGDNYYYMTIYNTIINPDPLYSAHYLTISNKDNFFLFDWVNENSELQFIATRLNFQRNLLTDQHIYKLSFKIGQSINFDYGMYYEETIDEKDDAGNTFVKTLITNNMKCVIVLYKDKVPYRWKEASLQSFDQVNYVSQWETTFETDNGLNDQNNIKINDLHVAGYETDTNYGYFPPNTKAVLYILGKFSEKYGRYNLDNIAPGFEDYSVTNVYSINDGIDFYENFTNILDTKIEAIDEKQNEFNICGIPMVGLHYMVSENHANYLVDAIDERKAYIDYCLILLENSMNIDFKLFNTYGPSSTYTMGDKENTLIEHLDLSLKFRVSLKSTSDVYTKDNIIKAIKDYIENLYETGDWHAPNMITNLMQEFSTRVNFIEFMNYNNFRLGIQHITKIDVDDPFVVPEFINVRNKYDEHENLIPCIEIEIVY